MYKNSATLPIATPSASVGGASSRETSICFARVAANSSIIRVRSEIGFDNLSKIVSLAFKSEPRVLNDPSTGFSAAVIAACIILGVTVKSMDAFFMPAVRGTSDVVIAPFISSSTVEIPTAAFDIPSARTAMLAVAASRSISSTGVTPSAVAIRALEIAAVPSVTPPVSTSAADVEATIILSPACISCPISVPIC